MVSEWWSGPPWVITHTRSKSWIEPMTARKTLMRMVGASSGRVTLRKRCQALAPSISAASVNSRGTDWSPASRSIMWKPKYFQVMTMNRVAITYD